MAIFFFFAFLFLIYVLLYSFLQYKKWTSINLLLLKKLVKKDGSELTFSDFVSRTITKTFFLFAYSFLITYALMPLTTYFDAGLTPVDEYCDTIEVKL